MADFRVDTGFFGHNKTKRLIRRIGVNGVFALMKFWAYAAMCKYGPEHVYTEDDIELAVDWDGDQGSLVSALSSVDPYIRFIDPVDGGYIIHDWDCHNGYAATASNRTLAAKAAADARWSKKRPDVCSKEEALDQQSCDDNADTHAGKKPHDATHMQTDALRNAPSPSPSPSPSKKTNTLSETHPPASKAPAAPAGAVRARPGINFFKRFWDAFADKQGKEPAWKAWQRIKGLDEPMAERIITAASEYAARRKGIRDRGGTPKMAQGWLTDRRWEDQVVVASDGTVDEKNPILAKAFEKILGEAHEQQSAA